MIESEIDYEETERVRAWIFKAQLDPWGNLERIVAGLESSNGEDRGEVMKNLHLDMIGIRVFLTQSSSQISAEDIKRLIEIINQISMFIDQDLNILTSVYIEGVQELLEYLSSFKKKRARKKIE